MRCAHHSPGQQPKQKSDRVPDFHNWIVQSIPQVCPFERIEGETGFVTSPTPKDSVASILTHLYIARRPNTISRSLLTELQATPPHAQL